MNGLKAAMDFCGLFPIVASTVTSGLVHSIAGVKPGLIGEIHSLGPVMDNYDGSLQSGELRIRTHSC